MTLEEVSDEDLKIGIEKSQKNAFDLIDEANILLEKNKVCRAYCLYQLATEEIGKSRLLFVLLMNRKLGEKINYKEINREFLHHQTKSKSAFIFEMFALIFFHNRNKDKPAIERRSDFIDSLEIRNAENNVDVLNKNKNNSLYIGVKDGKFIEPQDCITKEMAFRLRDDVLIRLETGRHILKAMVDNIESIVDFTKERGMPSLEETRDMFFDSFFKD